MLKKHGQKPGLRELKKAFETLMARIINRLESGEEKIIINDINDINYTDFKVERRIGF